MFLFKSILHFHKPPDEPTDKRKAKRYPVGRNFPFKAVVTLMAHDDDGNLVPDKIGAQAWAGRLTNLSENGAHIQVHAAAVAQRGESCTFKLILDDYRLEFPGTIAHCHTRQKYCSFGFSFDFPNTETQKAFLQLLEPVSIGASLVPVAAKDVTQDNAGLVKEQYHGDSGAMLTIWKRVGNPAVYSFDFRMNAYGVRWSEGMTEVEAYGMSKLNLAGNKTASPFIHLIDSELEEVRWLFCLAVPNLTKEVPQEIRNFLATLVG